MHSLGLDVLGVTLSSAAVVGLAATVPRTPSSWTIVGSHTLLVYLLHLYVLPAVDMPLAALAQAAAYFVHPEAALPTALLGALLLVRTLALPLPRAADPIHALRSVGQRLGWCATMCATRGKTRREEGAAAAEQEPLV